MDIEAYITKLGLQARAASREISQASTAQKNTALFATVDALNEERKFLLESNKEDLVAGELKGLDSALQDRLELTEGRIDSMIEGLRQVASLDDPVGEINDLKYRPSGIQVGRMRVPLGVIGIIYESRPNVTCEAASLCLKSGNATILRGGSEAIFSNQAISKCIASGLEAAGLNKDIVQVIDITDRAAVGKLITKPEFVDVIIPRGGKGLIERITNESRIPVIKHLDGNCHLYIDDKADIEKSIKVAINAKTQRYGTCCTLESLLVADSIAARVLPNLCELFTAKGVELRGCAKTRTLVENITEAKEADWGMEYLAPILSVKIVSGIDEAIGHINRYSSQHTEAIMTEDHERAQRFLR
jgi:glutamate-5-semialdehyde dehydrogenase